MEAGPVSHVTLVITELLQGVSECQTCYLTRTHESPAKDHISYLCVFINAKTKMTKAPIASAGVLYILCGSFRSAERKVIVAIVWWTLWEVSLISVGKKRIARFNICLPLMRLEDYLLFTPGARLDSKEYKALRVALWT